MDGLSSAEVSLLCDRPDLSSYLPLAVKEIRYGPLDFISVSELLMARRSGSLITSSATASAACALPQFLQNNNIQSSNSKIVANWHSIEANIDVGRVGLSPRSTICG